MTSTARSRIGNLESVPSYSNSDKSRIPNGTSFGKGIGNGGNNWNGGIWASTAIGSGIKSTSTDKILDEKTSRIESVGAVTGSKSLLSSSESDSWSDRQSLPWASLETTRPTLANMHTSHSSASSMRRQNSNQPPTRQPFAETSSNTSPNFSVNPLATLSQGFAAKTSHKQFLDPNSGSFVVPSVFDSSVVGRTSRHNSDEENRRAIQSVVFGAGELHSDHQNAYGNMSGYNSSAASRSGSLPPSRNSAHKSLSGDISANPQYSQFGHISTARLQHRPNFSAHAPAHPLRAAQQKFGDRGPLTHLENMDANLGRLRIGDHGQQTFADQGSVPYEHDYEMDPSDRNECYPPGPMQQQGTYDPYSPDGSVAGSQPQQWNQYRNIPFNVQQAHSQVSNHNRRNQVGSNYSATRIPQMSVQSRTPSHTRNMPDGQAVLLDQKLRMLQHQEHEYLLQQQQRQQMQYQQNQSLPPYDYNPDGVQLNTMNPTYYSIPPQYMGQPPPQTPKATAKEPDPTQPLRSALLDEFRSNNKTNKRYELKDIYNHIVEFSGDQHGSRFIQQKLETANSDEKDQVFREIHPNSIQLMTDVFGNYVIQKFFEHGNQSQKKILANSMKGHILTLSLQMYGCRVVQKALEHILTDQQASLISELANHVLRCVKDQNGNHVIQKAIERVPPIHIQFIITAFTGQVHALATHSFGCRVIQRMLEHCEEATKIAVLQELHACTSLLITDQYGNYVTQHVIEHGSDEDRERIIALVKAQLVHCSKHKFASNVVEKSIQFGSPEQRREIVAILTPLNEKGESPLAGVIRDQFGNYVVQKLLTTLKGAEYDDFVEKVKVQLNLLKRFTYGKQITAIEKIVYTGPSMMLHPTRANSSPPPPIDTSAAPTPPLLTTDAQSPQSSSHPSTNASTVDGPVGTRKASNSAPVEVGARSGGFDTDLE